MSLSIRGPGFKGTWNGVQIFQSDSVTSVAGGADSAGAMFGAGCFAYTLADARLAAGHIPPGLLYLANEAVVIEMARDQTNFMTSLIASIFPSVVEAEDLRGVANLSFERLNELNIVLNNALKNNCELIIFPEICLPYQWVSILTNFSRQNNIGIIAGIEHFTKNNRVYNYILSALPFKFNGYKNLHIDFRLKKDYSPDETNNLFSQ
jgi:hypothetical protein